MTRTSAIIAAAALAAGAATATAAPDPDRIAPGGNIRAVVEATERDGWPHETTPEESRAVTHLAVWYAGVMTNPGERAAVLCRFGATIARAHCGIAFHLNGPRVYAFRLNVRVWEDGSYRFTRKARRAPGASVKLPTVPFCNGSSPGFCQEVDPAIVAHIPPDAPPSR